MARWFRFLLLVLLALVLFCGLYMVQQMRDRFPGYTISLHIPPPATEQALSIGFGKTSITPKIPDTWTDVNEDAVYEPEAGDTYEDRNQNGKFDTQWIAGFGQKRAATGIHDSLWARAMVIDDGSTRMAIVAIDAIGFGHDDVIRVRKKLPQELGVTYATITSTHVHQAPDLVGLWGDGYTKSGVDPAYRDLVIQQTAQAIEQAVQKLEEAALILAYEPDSARALVADTRDPQVFDPGLRIFQAISTKSGQTLGSLLSWADHPETVWSDNLYISSDFPHYFREGVEKGIVHNDSLIIPGVGGIAVYVNGAIGGLMTTHPSTPIQDPFLDTTYLTPSFEKAEAQGRQLALLALHALRDSNRTDTLTKAGIGLIAKTINLPLDNSLFRLASALGIFDRGMPKWMHLRSEIAAWRLGPISCLQVPGEIYPEIVYGGIESPTGQDYKIAPVEVPPLSTFMPGEHPFVIGLANDLIGYIIPKSEWDEKAPYLYESDHAHYGEINSVGPETAPILHKTARSLLEDLSIMDKPSSKSK